MNDVTNLGGPDDPEMEALLRQALHDEAEAVQPGPGLTAIQRRARRRSPLLFRGLVAATALAVVAAGVTVGVALNRTSPNAADNEPAATQTEATPQMSEQSTTKGSTSPTTEPPPPGDPTGDPSLEAGAVPVFWIGQQDRLFREFHSASDSTASSRAAAAIELMLGAADPFDPDYQRGPWQTVTGVTVTQDGDALVVDLPAAAFSEDAVTEEMAQLALQQVVFTATGAAQAQGPVTILIDGQPGRAWDVVDVGEPMDRDIEARAWVWIHDPQEGQQKVAGTITVTGDATAFEGNVVWQVEDADGNVVDEGHTMTGANGEFAPFSFTVTLEPGTYRVRVTAPDMSGETDGTWDDHTFTVA